MAAGWFLRSFFCHERAAPRICLYKSQKERACYETSSKQTTSIIQCPSGRLWGSCLCSGPAGRLRSRRYGAALGMAARVCASGFRSAGCGTGGVLRATASDPSSGKASFAHGILLYAGYSAGAAVGPYHLLVRLCVQQLDRPSVCSGWRHGSGIFGRAPEGKTPLNLCRISFNNWRGDLRSVLKEILHFLYLGSRMRRRARYCGLRVYLRNPGLLINIISLT